MSYLMQGWRHYRKQETVVDKRQQLISDQRVGDLAVSKTLVNSCSGSIGEQSVHFPTAIRAKSTKSRTIHTKLPKISYVCHLNNYLLDHLKFDSGNQFLDLAALEGTP